MDRRRRGGRKRGTWAALSPLSVAIIGAGLVIWFAQFVPTTVYSDCGYALYWVGGWFSFTSAFQWIAATVAALFALWMVSFLDRETRMNWGEALAQGALLFAFAFWLVAIKSYLFPYSAPTQARMAAIVGTLFPAILPIEYENYPQPGADDPGRPKVEFDTHPLNDPAINKKTAEIFTSKYSPTVADMQRLEACVAEQRRALTQYKLDRETLRVWYEEEFYREKPKRPRDWKEEAMEELEREGE